ncbi:MAG: hypothetical protein JW947_03890 [Sedimentisphaerales bacterium]|nr:hypothetical protein [Sedimentisphaerales bacterium]
MAGAGPPTKMMTKTQEIYAPYCSVVCLVYAKKMAMVIPAIAIVTSFLVTFARLRRGYHNCLLRPFSNETF